jgi:chemotaxis protein histidine kinase CheA
MLEDIVKSKLLTTAAAPLALAGLLLAAPAASAGVVAVTPAVEISKKSDAEKAAEKAAKDAAKAAKEAQKAADKAAKEVQKAVEEAAKDAAKAAKEAEKAADKAAKDAGKDAAKAGQDAAARAQAAAAAVALIAEVSAEDVKQDINDAQREARSTAKNLRKSAQQEFAVAKKDARSAYKLALAEADAAGTKAERKALRAQAKADYAQVKKENRRTYLAGLEDSRRYNGKAQLIFFDPGVNELGEYDDPLAVAAVATSGLPVEISTSTPETCSVSDGVVEPLAPGDCVLVATQDGNKTYAPASTEATITITDQPDPQEITFSTLSGLTVGDSVQLAATATSGLAISFATQTPNVCSVDGSTVSALSAGTCTVVATQAGDEDWEAASPVSQSFAVAAPAEQPQDQ